MPGLVGLFGGEAFPGTVGTFVRLGGDEAAAVQGAPDGPQTSHEQCKRRGGHRCAVVNSR